LIHSSSSSSTGLPSKTNQDFEVDRVNKVTEPTNLTSLDNYITSLSFTHTHTHARTHTHTHTHTHTQEKEEGHGRVVRLVITKTSHYSVRIT